MARILVALSGGVDSSVAAALLAEAGHEVVTATMKLWGGPSDSGCCSVRDVDDARRVADRLGLAHHVFNFSEEFDRHVVGPYVAAHAAGRTPNPCIECNRHLKFDAFLARASRLGFDAVATGHHARVVTEGGRRRLRRGRDGAKDQSYVLACLTAEALERLHLPVGELTKAEVRAAAAARGLVTATKPDSQEVCFVAGSARDARRRFLAERIELHPGEVVDAATGAVLGRVEAVELVTVGQRRGLGLGGGERRSCLAVDVAARRVLVGDEGDLGAAPIRLVEQTFTGERLMPGTAVLAQTSAHGSTVPATLVDGGILLAPGRLVAPGQTVAFYDLETGAEVLGAGVAA